MRVLLIGGSHDGEWMNVPDDHLAIQLPSKRMNEDDFEFEMEAYQWQELYAKNDMNGDEFTFNVFVEQSLSKPEMMKKLISNYNPDNDE